MPNDIVPFDQFQPLDPIFKTSTVDVEKFSGGIQASFAILTIKGKEWGIRYRGVTQQLTAPNPMAGNALMPVQFLDVVLVDAAQTISKVYYIHGYKDGERTPPDCWSATGVTPDPASPHRQSATCRGCPHNVFGSKIGDGGQKGKACPDNKRLAIVPLSDIRNEAFGGPVMLRLPPGSFGLYSEFVGRLAAKHYPPFAVATRLTFAAEAFPKVVFSPLRPLSREEGALVLEVQKNPALERMLTDPAVGVLADDDGVVPTVAPPPAAVVPPPPVQQAPPVQTPPPAAAPVTTGFGVAAPVQQPAPVQAAQPAPSAAWGGAPAQPVDDLKPPPFLDRSQPQVITQPPASTAPGPITVQPTPEVLTPEQMKIRELEAQLASMKAAAPKKTRPKPVAPPAEPTPQAVITQPSNGAAAPQAAEASIGNQLADRIAALTGQQKP